MAATARQKPSGVKSQSATEAKQERGQTARIDKLERIVKLLVDGQYGSAKAEMEK